MQTEIILDSVSDLFSSKELLSIAPEELSDGDALLVWSLFDALEKEVVSKRKSVFRDHLLKLAEEKGRTNAKGSSSYSPPGSDGKVTRQCRQGKPQVDWQAAHRLADEVGCGDSLLVGTLKADKETFDFLLSMLEQFRGDTPDEFLDGVLNTLRGVEYDFSEDRLEQAVRTGVISLDELQSVTSIGDHRYALVVKKPSAVKKLMEGGKE